MAAIGLIHLRTRPQFEPSVISDNFTFDLGMDDFAARKFTGRCFSNSSLVIRVFAVLEYWNGDYETLTLLLLIRKKTTVLGTSELFLQTSGPTVWH